jgi:hypothetical protein
MFVLVPLFYIVTTPCARHSKKFTQCSTSFLKSSHDIQLHKTQQCHGPQFASNIQMPKQPTLAYVTFTICTIETHGLTYKQSSSPNIEHLSLKPTSYINENKETHQSTQIQFTSNRIPFLPKANSLYACPSITLKRRSTSAGQPTRNVSSSPRHSPAVNVSSKGETHGLGKGVLCPWLQCIGRQKLWDIVFALYCAAGSSLQQHERSATPKLPALWWSKRLPSAGHPPAHLALLSPRTQANALLLRSPRPAEYRA